MSEDDHNLLMEESWEENENEDRADEDHGEDQRDMKRDIKGDIKGDMEQLSSPLPNSKKRKLNENEEGDDFVSNLISSKKAAETIFNSNLFSLSLHELIKEVQVNYQHTKSVNTALEKFKNYIEKLEPKKVDYEFYQKKYSWLKFHNEISSSINFRKPDSIYVIGSYILQTQAKPELNIDIGILIPSGFFKPSDIENHIYLDKRLLYLTIIAEALEQNPALIQDISIHPFRGDIQKPIIKFHPLIEKSQEMIKSRFVVNILPMIRPGLFGSKKTLLNQSNLSKSTSSSDGKMVKVPSPRYNMAIVEDMMFERHLQLIHIAMGDSQVARDVNLVLKVWLSQRNMNSKQGDSFNGFLMCMLIVHLLQSKILDLQMSQLQMIQIIFKFIISYDWKKGIFMSPQPPDQSETDVNDLKLDENLKELYLSSFPVVIVDPSGRLNLTWRITPESWEDFLYEIKLSHDFLSQSTLKKRDVFKKLFLTPIKFQQKYDLVITVNFNEEEEQPVSLNNFYESEDISHQVISLLKKGYGNRIELIGKYPTEIVPISLNDSALNPINRLSIGVILSKENWKRLIDKGPPANDNAQVLEFQKIWGNKAESRRFRDGSILYCVVWRSPSPETRMLIFQRITLYLMNLHFPQLTDITLSAGLGTLMRLAIPESRNELRALQKSQPGNLSFYDSIMVHWEKLAGLLRSLELPLEIHGLYPVSEIYSYTDPFPPIPHAALGDENGESDSISVKPTVVILQFSSSGSWPDEITAMKKIKTAFLIRISNLLEQDHSILSRISHDYLDIFYQGFDFRIIIYHPYEAVLSCRLQLHEVETLGLNDDDESTQTPVDSLTGDSPLKAINEEKKNNLLSSPLYRDLVSRRLLKSILRGLHLRYPAFGPTARLTILWFARHMLLHHFHKEAIELIVAAVFTGDDNSPYGIPSYYQSAFIRVLELISTYDWENEPLIIDFTGDDLSPDDMTLIRKNFEEKQKKKIPFFISYISDQRCSIWTKDKPDFMIWKRTIKLATSAYNMIMNSIFNLELKINGFVEWHKIFSTSLEDYDVIIWLDPNILTRVDYYSVHSKTGAHPPREIQTWLTSDKQQYKNLDVSSIMVDYDPLTLYIKELEERLGVLAVFFYDPFAHVIGVLWKPSGFLMSKFKLKNCVNTIPISDKKNDLMGTLPNIFSILSDMKILGKGLVLKIELASNSAKLI